MESSRALDETIAVMERLHGRLRRDALEIADDDVRGILLLGSAILLHGLLESDQVYPRMTWLGGALIESL